MALAGGTRLAVGAARAAARSKFFFNSLYVLMQRMLNSTNKLIRVYIQKNKHIMGEDRESVLIKFLKE